MANRLEFSTSIDSAGFARGIREMESLSASAGGRINGSFAGFAVGGGTHGGLGGRGGVIGEGVVLLRELGRGNYGRIPGSLTIFMQRLGVLKYLIKDNALASELHAAAMAHEAAQAEATALLLGQKAAAEKIAMDASNFATASQIAEYEATQASAAASGQKAVALRAQATAAAQTAEAERVLAGSTGVAIGPIGWAVIALTALATVTYLVVNHFRKLREEAENLKEMTDYSTESLKDQVEAHKQAVNAARENDKWLRTLASDEHKLGDAIQSNLKLMRERAKLERDLAGAQGATKSTLQRMETADLKKQLEYTEKAIKAMEKKVAMDKAQEAAANNAYARRKSGGVIDIAIANDLAILDELKKKMATTTIHGAVADTSMSQFPLPRPFSRAANETDILEVTVNGKSVRTSVAEMTSKLAEANKAQERLNRINSQLEGLLSQKKKLTEDDNKQLQALQKEASGIRQSIGLSPLGAKVAAAEDAKSRGAGAGADALIRSGNFLGTAPGMINSIAEKQIRIAEAQLTELQGIHSKMGSAPTFPTH